MHQTLPLRNYGKNYLAAHSPLIEVALLEGMVVNKRTKYISLKEHFKDKA